MKIAFLDQPGMTYTAATPYEQPLGGTQSAACYLSAALAARGHQITLLSDGDHDQTVLGVRCLGTGVVRLRDILNDQDAVVVLSVPVGTKFDLIGVRTKRILWQHMAADFGTIQPHFTDPERSAWDARVYVSRNQMAAHVARGGRTGVVIGNGACPAFLDDRLLQPTFVERGEPPRMIFSSAPGRGLDFLLMSFPTLRRRLPGLTLSLCTGLSLYQIDADKDRFSLYYDWAEALDGVEMIGAVSQPRLAIEMGRSDIWGFPSRVTESACIAMMEAGLSGCAMIACDLGALSETAGGHATLLPLKSSRLAWTESFVEGVVAEAARIAADPAAANARRMAAREWFRSTCNWAQKAAEWEVFAEDLIRT